MLAVVLVPPAGPTLLLQPSNPSHSLRLLRVGDKPLRLLRNVRGLTLVELPDAESCCGFGGTFALKNADTSTAMLADKMAHVMATGAEVCSAGDSSECRS